VVFDICSHNYSIIYQKSKVREGNIRKSRAPGGDNSVMGALSGALNRAGAWTGAGVGGGKKTPRPGLLTGAGGKLGQGPPVSRPQRPCNEH